MDTTEQLHFHFSLSCIGEGNGNPLQCSCLENPRDGGGWWAAVYRVTQSRTRLKRLSSSSSSGSDGEEFACNAGDLGSIPGSGRSPGEGNSNPLLYSCLENPMDGGVEVKLVVSYFQNSGCTHKKQWSCSSEVMWAPETGGRLPLMLEVSVVSLKKYMQEKFSNKIITVNRRKQNLTTS